jgi:hypothetical protein
MTKQQTETKQNAERTRTEEFELSGDQVVTKIKELIHKGNIRRLSLQTDEGKTLFELPLTLGLAGVTAGILLAPVLTAVGLGAAMVTRLKIKVERVEETTPSESE